MIKNFKKLSAKEENEMILRAKQGDIYARNLVIENNLDLIQKIINKSITNTTLTNSDLVQEGTFGLVVAIEKFDLNLGFKFATYASWWVKQAMFKAISEQSYALNIPVYIQETVSRYNKIKQDMEKEEQKEVKKEVVAKKMKMDTEKIDTFLNVFNRAMSIEQGTLMTGNKELTLCEIIEDEKQNVEREVIDIELKRDIKNALENLAQKEKNVIILRFGLEDNKKQTLEEIGESYGVTKECIRQIEKRALNKLCHSTNAKALCAYLR
ncbi:MAG: sigma-70 family RNA polymerase sigma factor [Candidatus Gastranaerophilales bacterium]|nr:sigma-70 family RNA polymerase sigma factor [Candidatus Gastranaerophilales bacterium]